MATAAALVIRFDGVDRLNLRALAAAFEECCRRDFVDAATYPDGVLDMAADLIHKHQVKLITWAEPPRDVARLPTDISSSPANISLRYMSDDT